MKFKFKLFILILLLVISVSAVSAGDNETAINQTDNNIQESQVYDSFIVAEDVNVKYGPYNEFNVMLIDEYGYDIYGECLEMEWNDGVIEPLYEWDDTDGYNTYIDRNVGNYKIKLYLADSSYTAEPVFLNVKITKASVKLTAKEYYTTSGQYATMKVTIKDHNSDIVDEGSVKFSIAGKSYTVKVRDGVASKKVKLKNPKIYSYKATFSGKNYISKSVTSKVHVYASNKKARTFKIKGYTIVIPMDKFKKLISAKNTNKLICFKVDTGKHAKQTYMTIKKSTKWVLHKKSVPPYEYHPKKNYKVKNYRQVWISDGEYYLLADIYKKVTTTKKIYKTVNPRVYIVMVYGGKNGGQNGFPNKFSMYLDTAYQNPGYELTSGWLHGVKISKDIKTLNSAKIKKW